MPQIVYLLRHGEATSNIERVWSFKGGLTPVGIKQAKYWADYFKDKNLEVIYASTITRAFETAGIISKQIEVPIQKCDEIIEVNGGKFVEKRVDIPEKRDYEFKLFESWQKGEWDRSYPKGESFNGVKNRLEKFMSILVTNGSILVVSHQLTMMVFMRSFCVNHPEDINEYLLSCAGVAKLERTGNNKFKILELNVKPQIS